MADISNNIVAVLLVLVIVVSAIGTWAFLTAFEPVAPQVDDAGADAQVKLSIGSGPAEPVQTQAIIALAIAEEQ